MDTELLRTFLEVNRTRHFGKAADNLFVTQAAVSARIRLLEETTGVPLFTRARNNIQLTAAGQKFLRHAESILNTWNRARHEMAAEDESKFPLTIGSVASLWDMVAHDWTTSLYASLPNILLHAEVSTSTILIQQARESSLDMALVYEAPQVGELSIEEFATIKLVLVSTTPEVSTESATAKNYVYVDWGTAFSISHADAFPDLPTPVMRVDTAWLARSFILDRGGSAYLAYRMIAKDLESGRLHIVEGAPSINRPAYVIYSRSSERTALIGRATKTLKKIAKAQIA